MNVTQWKNSTLKNYQKKYKPSKTEVDHVLDYLKNHPEEKLARASYPQIKIKAEKWTKALNKKNKGLKEAGKVKVIHAFKNGFNFVQLLDKTALKWEGLHMGHCVASYSPRGIYSLRDNQGFPHATFEIARKEIVQLVGKANGKISSEYLGMVSECLKCFNCSEEIIKQHFIGVPDKFVKFLDEYYQPVKYLGYQGRKYAFEIKTKLIKPLDELTEGNINLLYFFKIKCEATLEYMLQNNLVLNGKTESELWYGKVFGFEYFKLFSKEQQLKLLLKTKCTDEALWKAVGYRKISYDYGLFLKEFFSGPKIEFVGDKCFYGVYSYKFRVFKIKKPLRPEHTQFFNELKAGEQFRDIPVEAFEYLIDFVDTIDGGVTSIISLAIINHRVEFLKKIFFKYRDYRLSWEEVLVEACMSRSLDIVNAVLEFYNPSPYALWRGVVHAAKYGGEWYNQVVTRFYSSARNLPNHARVSSILSNPMHLYNVQAQFLEAKSIATN